MTKPRHYKSGMKAAVHEAMEDLFLAGVLSETRMKACDDRCLTKAGKATVLARRERRRVKAAAKSLSAMSARNPHHGSTLDSFLIEEMWQSELPRPNSRLRKTMSTRPPWEVRTRSKTT